MKVKIGEKIYDSKNEPIMLILSDVEKKVIKNMNSKTHKICLAPGKKTEKEIDEFIE
jgi:hypothetical protein